MENMLQGTCKTACLGIVFLGSQVFEVISIWSKTSRKLCLTFVLVLGCALLLLNVPKLNDSTDRLFVHILSHAKVCVCVNSPKACATSGNTFSYADWLALLFCSRLAMYWTGKHPSIV